MPRTFTAVDTAALPKHFESAEAEKRWNTVWQEKGLYRYDPSRHARRDLRRRHAAADRVGLAAHRSRLQLHAHRRHRPLPADEGQEDLLPHGVGRQRAAHRAARAELLPRHLRPEAALRAGLRAGAGDRGAAQGPGAAGLAQELHRALPRAHGRGREGVQGALDPPRPLGRLARGVRDHRRPLPAPRAVLVHRPVSQGPRVQPREPDDVGRRFPHRGRPGRGRGPADRRRVSPHRLRRARHDARRS